MLKRSAKLTKDQKNDRLLMIGVTVQLRQDFKEKLAEEGFDAQAIGNFMRILPAREKELLLM